MELRWRPSRRPWDVRAAALEAIASGQGWNAVAGLICGRGEQLVAGAALTVLRTGVDGVSSLAGPGFNPEDAIALARHPFDALWAGQAAPVPLEPPVLPSGLRACWAGAAEASAERVVLLVFAPPDCTLRTRERRLLQTCLDLLQVALAKDSVQRQFDTMTRHFGAALSSITQGLCFFDGGGRLLLANARYAEIYDIDPARIRAGMTLAEIVALRFEAGAGPAMAPSQYLDWRERVHRDAGLTRTVIELANGRIVEICNQSLPDGGWVATHEDISARTGAEARVAHMARHDALTGLPNRLLFRERLEQALTDSRGIAAVLCLDLDGFKPVNDSFGHAAGDCLLQAVAARLRHCARETDTVSRLGGDEFAILATGLDRPERAAELAGRVTRALSEPFQIGNVLVNVSASVGIALTPGDGDAPEELLSRSDLALYQAKANERGAFRFFEPSMQACLLGRLRVESELREAIAREQFEVFYQPLLDLERGEVCSFEALLRWRHPERGLIGPGEFIPVAEESGLIVPLGAWVLTQACAEAVRWPDRITVSVNLSAAQFKSKSLIGAVQHALALSGLAASRLELEVTETLLLEHNAATLCTLRALSDLGVRVSMDDFGTGYSSLHYLRSFPFDKLKIDQSYIRDMAHRPDSLAIVRAILGLGRSLNMVTTAEGVETEAQLACLRAEGCNEVQGFLFSEPRPAADVALMLQSGMRHACRTRASAPAAA